MTIQQTLEQVFKVGFKKQPNLKILRGESHDASFVCDDKDPQRLIGLNVRKQKALTKVVIPKEWEALEYLNLSDNKNLERLEFAGALPNLGYLDLSDNDLKEIMLPDGMSALKDLTISNNKLTAITFQGNLPALRLLDLSSNHLVTLALPQGMESLQYLYLNNNNLTEFKPSRPLVKLDTLALKNNDFQDLPLDFLDAFYNLKTLYLQENPLSNPPKISIDKSSYGNSLGILKEHHIECAKGMEINNECKVLLIGNGSVGKTCFVIRLVENRFVKEWESTHAINLRQYPYKGYLLNLWDFAGQDIYHATHRLFMQRDAIYLVLWDKVTENTPQSSRPEGDKEQFYDNHSLNYWLHYCRMLGKDSPIIVVQTKVGKEGLEIKDCPQIRKDFTKKGHFLKFQHIE